MLGAAYLLSGLWSHDPLLDAAHVALDGTIQEARWRQSAMGSGPAWFLQLRLDGDPRGFIVAASRLSEADRDRFGPPAARSSNRIPLLEGKRATVVVDSSLQHTPAGLTPYMSALRVDGRRIVSRTGAAPDPPSPWKTSALLLLAGGGLLLGVGLLGASLHHVFLCLRHA